MILRLIISIELQSAMLLLFDAKECIVAHHSIRAQVRCISLIYVYTYIYIFEHIGECWTRCRISRSFRGATHSASFYAPEATEKKNASNFLTAVSTIDGIYMYIDAFAHSMVCGAKPGASRVCSGLFPLSASEMSSVCRASGWNHFFLPIAKYMCNKWINAYFFT